MVFIFLILGLILTSQCIIIATKGLSNNCKKVLQRLLIVAEMGARVIQNAELTNTAAFQLKWAFIFTDAFQWQCIDLHPSNF